MIIVLYLEKKMKWLSIAYFFMVEYHELLMKKLKAQWFLRSSVQVEYDLCVVWGSGSVFKRLDSIGQRCGYLGSSSRSQCKRAPRL